MVGENSTDDVVVCLIEGLQLLITETRRMITQATYYYLLYNNSIIIIIFIGNAMGPPWSSSYSNVMAASADSAEAHLHHHVLLLPHRSVPFVE